MKTKILGLFLIAAVSTAQAGAEWSPLSRSLTEIDLHHAAVDPQSSDILFVSGRRTVFRSEDGAKSWKKVLTVSGENSRIHCLYVDPIDGRNIYACSEKGLHMSTDSGKHWKLVFKGGLEGRKAVRTVVRRVSGLPSLWIGSADGLFRRDLVTGEILKVEGLPDSGVHAITFPEEGGPAIVVATDKGIYRSPDGMSRWERVETGSAVKEEPAELEQFEIEEFSTAPAFSELIYWPAQDKLLAAGAEGLLEASADASVWKPVAGENLPDNRINGLAAAAQTLYAATDRGVFRRDDASRAFASASEGLESLEVREIVYDARKNALLAATAKGIYRWQSPEYPVASPMDAAPALPTSDEVLARFASEPTIAEVQKVAIHYAEVHPDKISGWRAAAAKKALLPTVSLHASENFNENIDIDRGGTGDPDRFIFGPEEKSADWYVTASWDLGDLVWSGDQTSIDTRSRLMVELRGDILTEVTHLYYERRRLQVEMALSPAKDLPLKLEKEIRLSELTANLDALTGGYFSSRTN